MKKLLLFLGFLVGILNIASAQYCAGGPSSTFDSNLAAASITGDAGTSISYTGCPGVTGVQDLTASASVTLSAGGSYTLNVTPGSCGGNYGNALEAWIDWDQNGVFDASESVGTWTGTPPAVQQNFSVNVPASVAAGTTRMRIQQQESGFLPLDPCANFTWGSVVDFEVVISPSFLTYCAGGPSSTFDSNLAAASITGDAGTSISYTGCPGVTGLEDLTGSTSVTLSAGGVYTLNVTPGSCGGNYGNALEAWIDWDQNGVFDASESVGTWSGTPGAVGALPFSVTVPASANSGVTTLRIQQQEGGSLPLDPCASFTWGSKTDFGIALAPPSITCFAPSQLSVTALTSSSADLNWVDNSASGLANIEYGPAGFTPGTGTLITGTTNNPESISGLNPQTSYEFYVQSDCGGGDLSTWSGPFAFTTPCAAVIAPWTETFTTVVTPTCWSQSTTTGGPWVFTGNPGYDCSGTLDHTNGSTNNYAWIDFSGTDAGVILTTPVIDVSALNVPELRFWEKSYYAGVLSPYNFLYVEASDGLGNWNLVATYQGDLGPTWFEQVVVVAPFVYTSGANDLIQLRFRAESGGAGADFYNDILIDDVSVVEAPTCPQPIDLIVDSADLTSVSLSWTPIGSETEWYVEYGAPGFTPGTGTVAPLVTPNPYTTITGLGSNQLFEAYVRAFCTVGDTSFYTGGVLFNTFNQPPFMESDNACGPGFNDISSTGTLNLLGDDGEVGTQLPFSFLYQGLPTTDITIGSNGAIIFGSLNAQVGFTNQQMTNQANGLYAFWDDLGPEVGPTDGVYFETIGVAPNQQFIVQWNKRHLGGNNNPYIFQAVIDQASNEIYFIYDDVEVGNGSYDLGGSATIGIAGPNQDIQLSYNNTQYLTDNSCAHFYYTDCPKPSNFSVTYTTVSEGAITWSAGLANETDWTVIYGVAGFDPTQSGTTVQTSTPALIMPGLNDITCYDVYIYADCSGSLQSGSLAGTFCTLPNCANPSAIAASSAVDTVMSNWTWVENPGYPSTGFGVQYGFAGFAPGTGTVSYIDNNFTDTTADAALIGGGVYDIYVQAVCGTDSSAWTGPIAFTMPLTNDSTCFAEDLAVDGTFMTFSNVGATTDANEGTIAPPATGYQTQNGWGNSNVTSTVWFTFTAPPSGNVRASCEGINFDGQLAAYEVTQCDSFPTYTLIGANDDLGVSFTENAPLLNLCGLTPGAQYYLMYDSWSTFSQGTYNLTLSEVVVEAGTDNGLTDVCIGDTVDLFNNLTGNDLGGTWFEQIPTANFSESNFVSAGLASQVFYFDYVVVDGCATDSIETSVEVYAPSSAGIDGTITACQNQPINLLAGLSGNVDVGGQWYDPSNSPTSPAITASSIPGQFNYDYITGNGVCPDDTANVIVDVDIDCDYLNLQELYFEGMDVYPNPTTGMIYISNSGSDEVFNIELTDLNGKVIRALSGAINGTETTEVSLEQFETGFYLIRVFNDNAEKTFRIVKQ